MKPAQNPLPDPLIGPLLEYTHVLGHKGTVKTTKNISTNVKRENMYSPCKNLQQSLWLIYES